MRFNGRIGQDRGKGKRMTYTALIKQVGSDWIGWIEEIPGVNCQEPTYELLLETLGITLKEAIDLNREEAIHLAGPNYREQSITL